MSEYLISIFIQKFVKFRILDPKIHMKRARRLLLTYKDSVDERCLLTYVQCTYLHTYISLSFINEIVGKYYESNLHNVTKYSIIHEKNN